MVLITSTGTNARRSRDIPKRSNFVRIREFILIAIREKINYSLQTFMGATAFSSD